MTKVMLTPILTSMMLHSKNALKEFIKTKRTTCFVANCNKNPDEIMTFFLVRKQVSEFLAFPKTPWFRMKISESDPVRTGCL